MKKFFVGITLFLAFLAMMALAEETEEVNIEKFKQVLSAREIQAKKEEKEKVAGLKKYLADSSERWVRLNNIRNNKWITEKEKSLIIKAIDMEESNIFLTYKFGYGIGDPVSVKAYKNLMRESFMKNEGIFLGSIALGIYSRALIEKEENTTEMVVIGAVSMAAGGLFYVLAPDGWAVPMVDRHRRPLRIILSAIRISCGYYLFQ